MQSFGDDISLTILSHLQSSTVLDVTADVYVSDVTADVYEPDVTADVSLDVSGELSIAYNITQGIICN